MTWELWGNQSDRFHVFHCSSLLGPGLDQGPARPGAPGRAHRSQELDNENLEGGNFRVILSHHCTLECETHHPSDSLAWQCLACRPVAWSLPRITSHCNSPSRLLSRIATPWARQSRPQSPHTFPFCITRFVRRRRSSPSKHEIGRAPASMPHLADLVCPPGDTRVFCWS